MIDTLLALIHSLFFPLIQLIAFLIPALKRRLDFEKKNKMTPESLSFGDENRVARLCFEVSSEGELEQVRAYLEDRLKEGNDVELIICSPSVERAALRLYSEYKNHLRVLRLPLVSFSWFFESFGSQSVKAWITAPTLVLCRYDFFPELMILSREKKSKLMAATLKNKDQPGSRLKAHFRTFDEVYTSTQKDAEKFRQLVPKASVTFLELRFLSIHRRFQTLEKKTSEKKIMKEYQNFLQNFKGRKLVLGSFWDFESELFLDPRFKEAILKGDLHIAVFPHLLDAEHVQECVTELKKILPDIPLHVIQEGNQINSGGIHLILEKGFLTEFYHFYDDAYVGGGFGRSIHSVLEPFMGGCRIFCGSKTHRSSEFDLVQECSPSEIFVLQHPEQFGDFFFQDFPAVDRLKRENMLKLTQSEYQKHFKL